MEFKSLGNIETSFRQIRLYAFVFAIVCVAVSGYAVYASYSFAKEQREKIYVLDQGKSLMLALSQDASRNRPVEAREHVRRFHELFFSLITTCTLQNSVRSDNNPQGFLMENFLVKENRDIQTYKR